MTNGKCDAADLSMNNQTSREAFEEYIGRFSLNRKLMAHESLESMKDGKYAYKFVQDKWDLWQAATQWADR